jgi:hypothetical protein
MCDAMEGPHYHDQGPRVSAAARCVSHFTAHTLAPPYTQMEVHVFVTVTAIYMPNDPMTHLGGVSFTSRAGPGLTAAGSP